MKRFLVYLIVIMSVSTFLKAEEKRIDCIKTYIEPGCLEVLDSWLYVMVDGLWVRPGAIEYDGQGYFFSSVISNDVCPGPWQCQVPGCLHWNREFDKDCRRCGTLAGRDSED